MKFHSPVVFLYILKSTIRPCIKHRCHVLDGAHNGYYDRLDKLKTRICKAFDAALAASLEAVVHRQNVAS